MKKKCLLSLIPLFFLIVGCNTSSKQESSSNTGIPQEDKEEIEEVSFDTFLNNYFLSYEELEGKTFKDVYPNTAYGHLEETPTQYKGSTEMQDVVYSPGRLIVDMTFTAVNNMRYEGEITSATYEGEEADLSDSYLETLPYNLVPSTLPFATYLSFVNEEESSSYYWRGQRGSYSSKTEKKIEQIDGNYFITRADGMKEAVTKTYVLPNEEMYGQFTFFIGEKGYYIETRDDDFHTLVKTNKKTILLDCLKEDDDHYFRITYTL